VTFVRASLELDSHYDTQITMIRTIEQMLGIKPMNQKDSAATPMAAAFTQKPDFTPFKAVPNRTSLTAGLSTLPPCGADAPVAQNPTTAPAPTATVPADQQAVAAQWVLGSRSTTAGRRCFRWD